MLVTGSEVDSPYTTVEKELGKWKTERKSERQQVSKTVRLSHTAADITPHVRLTSRASGVNLRSVSTAKIV